MDFLSKNKESTKLFKILSQHDDEKVFANPTIDIVINKVWELHYPRIVKFVFVPYLVYFITFISYIVLFFNLKKTKEGEITYVVE